MTIDKITTIIPTFFTTNNQIDYNLVYKHIEQQISNNIKSIVILDPNTSESLSLTQRERNVFAFHIFKNFADKINISVGISGFNTVELVEEIKQINNCAHNFIIGFINHVSITQEGIFQHYKALIDASTKPIIINNNPENFGVNIEPETIKKIYEYSTRVIGIADTFLNMDKIILIKKLCPKIIIWSTNDNLILPALSLGAYGVFSIFSNFIPTLISTICFGFETGENNSIQDVFYKIKKISKLYDYKLDSVTLKYYLSKIYNEPTMEIVRLPLITLDGKFKNEFIEYDKQNN